MLSIGSYARRGFVWLMSRLGLAHLCCGSQLTMRVSEAGPWSSVDIGAASKYLKSQGHSQSAWAHVDTLVSPHLPPFEEVVQELTGRVPANLALHVLSMFVACHKGGTTRNKIAVVTFASRAVPRKGLACTIGEHLLPQLACCHRDISMAAFGSGQEMERRLKAAAAAPFKYTKDQLAPLYEVVEGRGLVGSELAELAKNVFARRP